MFFSDKWSFSFICLFLFFYRRKFGLVCALLNQCVYILFVLLLMIMMKKQVDAKEQDVSCFILGIKIKHSFSKFICRVLTPKIQKESNACPLTCISLYKLPSLKSHISPSLHDSYVISHSFQNPRNKSSGEDIILDNYKANDMKKASNI